MGLAHNRLSILDLNPRGSQPMHDESAGLSIIFVGEIYNYIEIREELTVKGERFVTTTDTEVLLYAFKHWSVKEVLNKCNGMFAFALLDVKAQRLILARDRFGVKPLYVQLDQAGLIFASEIKGILAGLERRWEPNPLVVARYASQFLLESEFEETFFEGIQKLPAAHFVSLDLRGELKWAPERYYDLQERTSPSSLDEAAIQLKDLLHESLSIRLRSDVPVGILLSGGLDSSALAAVSQSLAAKNLRFFSVTSSDPEFNEEPFIDSVAAHLKIPVEKVNVGLDAEKIWSLLPSTLWSNDEPLTSLSAVAYNLMLERAAETGIVVLLTGQGGDEVFCGYKKYVGFVTGEAFRRGRWRHGFKTLADFALNRSIVNDLPLAELKRYVPGLVKDFDILGDALSEFTPLNLRLGQDAVRERQIADLTKFSVPALLHYEDRLSMAHSREVREPYLDYRLVEFGLSLPSDHKISAGWTKRVLREAVKAMLPKSVVYRKDKKGFTIPQEKWLRQDLQSRVDELLLDEQSFIYRRQYVRPREMQRLWDAFKRGKRGQGWKDILTPVLLEMWLRRFEPYLTKP